MALYCRVGEIQVCIFATRPSHNGSIFVTLARSVRNVIASIALGATALTAMPAAAQENAEVRLRKLEAEVRALQRNVFPGGDGKYFEPEITTQQAAQNGVATPSTTAVTDMLARLDAMETQLQRLTAQVELNGNSVRDFEARLSALEGTPVSGSVVNAPALSSTPVNTAPAAITPVESAAATPPATTTASVPTALGPTAQRLAAVQEIAKPQTDDPGDDEYSYGYRLWNAGFFPEAQQQLALFLEKYPNHSRTTYGRNLLGRAYLDDDKPREAAPWFLKNYQTDKQARRAPDSLLYLAESMIALKDTGRACIALAEFGETYPALASGRLLDQYEANRAKVNCD